MSYLPIAFFSLGITEMLVIAVVALLVFGGRLPETMRTLGQSYAKFRHGMSDLSNPIRQEMRRLQDPLRSAEPQPTDLPPAADEPPPSVPYEPTAVPDTTEPAAPETTPDTTSPASARSARPSRGVADEPPPV